MLLYACDSRCSACSVEADVPERLAAAQRRIYAELGEGDGQLAPLCCLERHGFGKRRFFWWQRLLLCRRLPWVSSSCNLGAGSGGTGVLHCQAAKQPVPFHFLQTAFTTAHDRRAYTLQQLRVFDYTRRRTPKPTGCNCTPCAHFRANTLVSAPAATSSLRDSSRPSSSSSSSSSFCTRHERRQLPQR